MSLNVSTVLASDPMDVTKYVAIHTFNVPSDIDVKMGFTVRFEFTQPSNWTFLDDNVPPVVPVVRGERAIESCKLSCILIILSRSIFGIFLNFDETSGHL